MAPAASRASMCLVVVLALSLTCQVATARPAPVETTGLSELAQQIVKLFEDWSSISESVRNATDSITDGNACDIEVQISQGLVEYKGRVEQGSSMLEQVSKAEVLSIHDAVQVVVALRKFVYRYSLTLVALTDIHGVLMDASCDITIGEKLGAIKTSTDDFAGAVVYRIPSKVKTAAKRQFEILDKKLQKAISTYEGNTLFADH